MDSSCSNPNWDPPGATGLSGFVVIAESHISSHTFVEAGYVFLDVFSCKPFDTGAVVGFVRRELGATRIHAHVERRGRHFPVAAVSP